MSDAILDVVRQSLTSPWAYVAIFALAAIDGFFPAVPGESLTVTAGVLAVTGATNIPLVIGASALGAFTGDHVSYAIGRAAGGRLRSRMRPGTRRRATYDRARRVLAARGGVVLIGSRYVPGIRTATTMTAGAVGYPLRRFTLFDAVAALYWATGWALVGYLGGVTFEGEPGKGILLGLAFAVSVTTLIEAGRYLWRRARSGGTGRTGRTGTATDSGTIDGATNDATDDGAIGGEDDGGTADGTRDPPVVAGPPASRLSSE